MVLISKWNDFNLLMLPALLVITSTGQLVRERRKRLLLSQGVQYF